MSPTPAPPHAEIPTPSWRPYVPSAAPLSTEVSISSDDTSSEACLQLHNSPALKERERWAGPLPPRKPIPGRATPLFPTPREAVTLIRAARRRHAPQPRAPSLAALCPALSAYAGVDDALSCHRDALAEAAKDSPASATGTALAALAEMQRLLRDKANDLQNAVTAAAREVGCNITHPVSLSSLAHDVERIPSKGATHQPASASHDALGQNLSLTDCVRREIDASKYPVLAKTFTLREGYCLDGTGRVGNAVEIGQEHIPDQRGKQEDTLPYLPSRTENVHAWTGFDFDEDAAPTSPDEDNELFYLDRHRPSPEPFLLQGHSAPPLDVPSPPVVSRHSRAPAKAARAGGKSARGKEKHREHIRKGKKSRLPREKNEKRSYRILDVKAEFVPSSDPSDTAMPSYSNGRNSSSPMQQPMTAPAVHFESVLDNDGSDEDVINQSRDVKFSPPVVVELDTE